MKISTADKNNNREERREREREREHAGRGNEEIMQSGTRRDLGHRSVHPDSVGLAASKTPGSADRPSSHAW